MKSTGGPLRARWVAAWVLLLGALGSALAMVRSPVRPRADFVFNNGGEVMSLDPHTAAGVPEARVARALFEPLMTKEPKNLQVVGGTASSYDGEEGGRLYRFHLRPEARWSNGDPLTAADFAWSFHRILDPETACENAYLLYCIVGAREFHSGLTEDGAPAERDWEQVGIEATDEHTLEIRLVRPNPQFIELMAFHAFVPVHRESILAMRKRYPSTWRREWMRPQNLVTNGPFKVAERRIGDRLRLVRNPFYWDADNVAFRTIDVLSVERFSTALNLYLTGDIDWLDGSIPPTLVKELQTREDFQPAPYLGTYFYRINTTQPPFDDPRVRTALSYAVDRATICDDILGAGQTPSVSFVPRGRLGGYHSPALVRFDSDLARERMTEAGYYGPDSKPFPPIEIHYNQSESHRDIAEFIAEGWRRTFGFTVRLRSQERKIHLDRQKNLDYNISRSSWIADTAQIGSFLDIWVTGGENNRTGWSNEQYDELVRMGSQELGTRRRNDYYQEAERILLQEAPVIPIYDYVSQNLVNPRLGGFHGNLLNEHFPKDWYWKDQRELNQDRQQLSPYRKKVKAPGPQNGLYSKTAQAARAARKTEQ